MQTKIISLATLMLAGAGLAAAESTDYCGGAKYCWDLTVANNSSATVTKVKVTQEKTDGACEKDERTYSQNLAGNAGSSTGGDTIELSVNAACKYKVKFTTTSGCTGDKVTHVGPTGTEILDDIAELVGGCGTLKARS